MLENIRKIDKSNVASGLLRVGFIEPNLDLVIFGCPRDLNAFVHAVLSIKDNVQVPACTDTTHVNKLNCVCEGPNFIQYQHIHVTNYSCPLSVTRHGLCTYCSYQVLQCYYGNDACKIINSWNTCIKVSPKITFCFFALRKYIIHCVLLCLLLVKKVNGRNNLCYLKLKRKKKKCWKL